MYKIYTDRSEILEARIKASGVTKDKVKCRVIAESANWSLLFNGKVSSDGDCKVRIPPMSNIFDEGETGTLTLEVIADNTVFTLWEEEFVVGASKSIKLESVSVNSYEENENPSNVTVSLETPLIAEKVEAPKKKKIDHSKKLFDFLVNENININKLNNSKYRKKFASKISEFFDNEPTITDERHKKLLIQKSLHMLNNTKD